MVEPPEDAGDANHVRFGPVKVFISFSATDADLLYELEKHLAQLKRDGIISIWHRGMAVAGEMVEIAAREHLTAAEIVVVLLSADQVASEHGHQELTIAMDRQSSAGVKVIPVLARPMDLAVSPLGALQFLPSLDFHGDEIS